MVENYSEDSIRTLDWREHIRLRPVCIRKIGGSELAMDDGIYILVKRWWIIVLTSSRWERGARLLSR